MTESEAIEWIKELKGSEEIQEFYYVESFIEAFDIAIQVLEKQIPKKPIMRRYFEDLEEEYLCCPTCGEILTDRIPADNKTFYFHCMNCGQKFDWEGDKP